MAVSPRHQSSILSDPDDHAATVSPDEAPSRRQYRLLKAQAPHAILLYRLGDFYEAFDDDASVVARDARITLTSRSFGRSGRVPMAGIPHHALNHYLGRLLAAGHTIAIAEQLGEPGHGLVERAITRVLSPGTVADAELLPAAESRYLAAVALQPNMLGLAWLDVSTGEFAAAEHPSTDGARWLADELTRLNPAEVLAAADAALPVAPPGHLTRLSEDTFTGAQATARLGRQLDDASLRGSSSTALSAATAAAGAVLAYVEQTNPALLPLVTRLRTEPPSRTVILDEATRRNLEITRGLRSGSARGSLLAVLDVCRTAMGSRTLRRILGQPLVDQAEISARQEIVAGLVEAPTLRARLATTLARIGDLERLLGRISRGGATSRDFAALRTALTRCRAVATALDDAATSALRDLSGALTTNPGLRQHLDDAITEGQDGAVGVRPGYWPSLDALVSASSATRQWLVNLECAERERTGIRSLKVAYNKVFGYYIEVTRANLELVPADYVRKQTVANGERYYTAALKEAEARLQVADDEIARHERAALDHLTNDVIANLRELQAMASGIARLDMLLALADIAARQRWTRPALYDDDRLAIVAGRHPVVEDALGGEPFLPNDCHVGGDGPRLLLVTGPNMGGKSTYLRQVAIIVLLAQVGSFVPADAAAIGLVDGIYSRVGAHDDLAGGRSTFMVEMIETAAILQQAGSRSLVILDEVGRGTGTADGLALAQAVMEDLHDRVGARTLFATHFLELTSVAGWRGSAGDRPEAAADQDVGDRLDRAANVHVAAIEADADVILLHAVRPGPAGRAFGIQVARLAGLPAGVVQRAATLAARRSRHVAGTGADDRSLGDVTGHGARHRQLPLRGLPDMPDPATALAQALFDLDLPSLTPGQAIDWLIDQRARLAGNRASGADP